MAGLIIERHSALLEQGAMIAGRHDSGAEPRLLVAVTHEITDGHDPARTVSEKSGFVEMDARSPEEVRAVGEARCLDYEPLDDPERAVAAPLRDARDSPPAWRPSRWTGPSPKACPGNWPGPANSSPPGVSQVHPLVKQRLDGKISYWDMRHPT